MKHRPTISRTRRRGALLALLSSLVLGIALLGVSGAAAHSRDHRPSWHIGHGWPAPPSDQALALQWFDLTNQTVAAAGFPEPVTQSRTWAVSWIAADRAVQDGFGPRFQDAAFATALHDTLVAQVPGQQAPLDTALASTLSGIPNGWDKSRGIAAGQHEASLILAQRAGDGLDTASVDSPTRRRRPHRASGSPPHRPSAPPCAPVRRTGAASC